MSSGRLEPRDQKILTHIGRYRISLRAVLGRLFFDGRDCGNVMKRLRGQGFVRSLQGLPGRISYYQLTEQGTALMGFPRSRASPVEAQALHTHLGILWFCCVGKRSRFRLEKRDLDAFFGGQELSGHHCLEERGDRGVRLYRLYVPTFDADNQTVLTQIRNGILAARLNPSVREWITSRRYAFAVLVETDERRAFLARAIRKGPDPLIALSHIHTEIVPGHRTIQEKLRELAGPNSTSDDTRPNGP